MGQTPPPVITSVSPLSGPVGTTVTIEGQYFNSVKAGNIVRFGTVKASIIAGSSTSLTVEVPAGAASYGPVSVTNWPENKSAFSDPFTLTFPHGIVFPETYFIYDYLFPSGIYGGTLGDFNNDGFTDLAAFTYNGIYIRLNNGSGGFATAKPSLPVGWTYEVSIADYNGDGNLDLIAAHGNAGVSLSAGNSDGTFDAKVDIMIGKPESVATGDFNNDGHVDIVVASRDEDSVSILLNNGIGSFPDSSSFYMGNRPSDIVVADFDGDGNQDVAVSNYMANGTSILFGNGAGGFSPRKSLGMSSMSVAYGDFNEDGRIDLVSSINSGNRITLHVNQGNRAFDKNGYEVAADEPRSIITGDFNGDGQLDIASTNVYSDNVSLLLGDGTGDFLEKQDFLLEGEPLEDVFPRDLKAADVNNDGRTDIVTFNQNSDKITVLRYIDPPTIIEDITEVTANSASVNCFALVNDYGLIVEERGIAWSTSPTPTLADSHIAKGSGAGAYSILLTGLTTNSLYYVRPYVINSEGTFYGNEVAVITMPSITTKKPTNINPGYAESGGVIDLGGEILSVYDQGVCWSKSPSPTIEDRYAESNYSTSEFTAVLTNLEPLTTYFVRAFIETSEGDYVYGNEYEFTTNELTLNKITDFIKVKQLNPLGGGPFLGGRSLTPSALEGDLAIVPEGSKAVIYERNAGGTDNWGETATLSIDSLESWQLVNVAINKEVAVIRYFNSRSHVYIFQQNESEEWVPVTHISYNDTRIGDSDGGQLVLDHHKLVTSTRDGVYIYEQDKGGINNWGLVKEIPLHFTRALDIHEGKLVVSHIVGEVDNIVRVYYQNQGGADNWGEVTDLATDGSIGSVAIHGGQIIAGAPDSWKYPVGKAYIFEKDLGGVDHWGLAATMTSGGAGDGYGTSVAIAKDVAMVGAYDVQRSVENVPLSSKGAIYVLAKNNVNEWVTSQKLNEESTVKFSQFGRAVALSGNTAIFTSESAYIYEDPTTSSLQLSSNEIPENDQEDTVIGTFSTGGTPASPVTYTLISGEGDDDNAHFSIAGNQLKSSETFNYETKSTYSIRVKVSDNEGFNLEKTFTIHITDINEAPVDIFITEHSVPGGSPAGTLVGTFSGDGPDQNESHSFELVDGEGSNDNGSFTIDGNELYLTEIADYNTKPEYQIRVMTTDKGGLTTEKTFVISVVYIGELRISLFPKNAGICKGNAEAVFHVNIKGALDEPAVEWLFNSEPVIGEENDTLVLTDFTEGDLIQVKVTARDASDNMVKTLSSPEYAITLLDIPDATISAYGFIITASEGSDYQWYYNNTLLPDSTRSIIAKGQGDYWVRVFSESNCSATSEPIHMFVTGTAEEKPREDIRVYPNPAQNKINISIPQEMLVEGTITVYDLPGNVIYRQKKNDSDFIIDISSWTNGYYILNIISEREVVRKKILKTNE